MRKTPIAVSVAMTGARYSPSAESTRQHAQFMPLAPSSNIRDAEACAAAGATYFHFHARNSVTGEQFADPDWYGAVTHGMRTRLPKAIVSFGSSRKGSEVHAAIHAYGECARSVGLFSVPDAFTNFADVELASYESPEYRCGQPALAPDVIRDYYFQTSDAIHSLGLIQEIEITTYPKSFQALERLYQETNLHRRNRMHIVLLLGFSAALPISKSTFDIAVERAWALLGDIGGFISVGAVIRPDESTSIDALRAMEWCLEDDRVTMFRTGIEDSPAINGVQVHNADLVRRAVEFFSSKNCPIETDGNALRRRLGLSTKTHAALTDVREVRSLFMPVMAGSTQRIPA